ncbi:MAG: PP2C family protein-serine/threonine phosphatase [Gammaproteobacteria bacterium]
MTGSIAAKLQRIGELSAIPITPANFITRLHQSADTFFPGVATALLRRRADAVHELLGLVDYHGTVRAQPGRALEAVATAGRLGSLEHAHGWQPLATLELAPPLSDLQDAGAHGLYVDLPLGHPADLAVALLRRGDAPALHDHGERTLAFTVCAVNLLRRLERLRLVEAQSWIEGELAKLSEMQNLLRPTGLDELVGLDVAIESRPHRYAGGDYYDLARLAGPDDEPRYSIALADVSGHGPAAAAEAAMIDTIMRTYSTSEARHERPGPASVMTYVNRHMFSRKPRPSFATALLALWLPAARRLRYASAGHLPPLLRPGRGGPARALETGEDIPLNILRDYVWQEHEIGLGPGDVLVLYTDGITEALSPDGKQFGFERVRAAVDAAEPRAAAVLEAVSGAVRAHTGGRPNDDDQTVVVVGFG